MTIAKSKSNKDGKLFLKDAFTLEQKLLQVSLEFSTQSVTHSGSLGDVNEKYFIDVLRKYLPARYAVNDGIIIDCTGSTSDQIDVIIYDNQYTPTLLDQKNHRFVPAEAVYAVFEVKPTINKSYLEYAAKKAESVRKLKRTTIPIVQAGGGHPVKELFNIVAGIVAGKIEWENGFDNEAFLKHHSHLTGDKSLDCGLSVAGFYFDTYNGSIKIGSSEHALAYFMFRFLQKLQSLGTVSAIDWNSYATAIDDLKT
jgi:Domain of unknown function (DUF6602)